MSKMVTTHLIKVFLAFKETPPDQWLTVAQAATRSGINPNTTKSHIRSLVEEKILDKIDEMRPHRYKLSDGAGDRLAEIERLAAIALQGDS